jgi:hypothetical protein
MRHDRDGHYLRGWLQEYDALMWLEAAEEGHVPTDHAKSIDSNLSDLLFTLHRLDWQKSLLRNGRLQAMTYMRYVDLDIDGFHVKLRSAFDHLAAVVAKNSPRPGEVPSRSFHGMLNWLDDEPNRERMGKGLARVVGSAKWFKRFMEIRDSIVHQGEQTLAYPESDRVCFQVYKEGRDRVDPILKVNDDIVDFELYSALYLGRSLDYFDRVCRKIFRIRRLRLTGTSPKRYNEGIPVLKAWIRRLVAEMES